MSISLAPALPAGIITAVLTTACVAPYITVEHQRHGHLRPAIALHRLCVLGYGAALLCFVLLPLPADDVHCRDPRWTPRNELSTDTATGTAQVLCNIALFVPLGALARRNGTSMFRATALGGLCSLAVELTQLTGIWGLYPCAYRVFDVDDLLANTTGALLGTRCVTGPVRSPRLHAHRPPVMTRRVLSRSCDLATLWWCGSGLLVAVRPLVPAGLTSTHPHVATAIETAALWFVPGSAILLCLARTGATPGDHMVRLAPPRSHRTPRAHPVVLRSCTSIGAVALCQGIAEVTAGQGSAAALLTGHLLHTVGLFLPDRRAATELPPCAQRRARTAYDRETTMPHNRPRTNTGSRRVVARAHRPRPGCRARPAPNTTDR